MHPKLREFLQRWLINIASVLVAAKLLRGIYYDTNTSLLAATLLLGILNAVIRPLLLLLALPLVVLTVGIFVLFINAFLLYFVGRLVSGFHVDSFGSAFWGGLIISVVSMILNSLTGTGGSRLSVRRGGPPPPPPPPRGGGDGGSGPVIDI